MTNEFKIEEVEDALQSCTCLEMVAGVISTIDFRHNHPMDSFEIIKTIRGLSFDE